MQILNQAMILKKCCDFEQIIYNGGRLKQKNRRDTFEYSTN